MRISEVLEPVKRKALIGDEISAHAYYRTKEEKTRILLLKENINDSASSATAVQEFL